MAAVTINSSGDCSSCCGCAPCACKTVPPATQCPNCPCDTPDAIALSFIGGSMQTTCLDCVRFDGFHFSVKVVSGTLAGNTFVLVNTAAGPCVYTFSTGAGGPIVISEYAGWGCTGAPIGTSDTLDLSVTLLGGGNIEVIVRMLSTYDFFNTLGALFGIGDCCRASSSTDSHVTGDCSPGRLGWGATAIITPCP